LEAEIEWVEIDGMTASGALQLARTDLVEILSAIVSDVYSDHLPLHMHGEIAPAVKSGPLSACHFLLKHPDDIRDENLWRVLFGLPSYWVPPVARSEPPWPNHQLQAYRWTAIIVAYSVRNALEDLYTKHIPDQLMPSVNRAVRNSIYEVLVDAPSLGWRLSRMPMALLRATAETGWALRLPHAVG
jgi:hypothetical protein